MCTILLAWRHRAGTPIVLAANRDELLVRPTLDPHVLHRDPLIVGGQDAVAGGTWLAVRADGVVAAVTNRRVGDRDPTRRSRGELPIAMLETATDDEALAFLHALRPTDYNPFNALYVSPRLAVVAHAHGDSLEVIRLDPGLHVLTVYDLDDRSQPKVAAISAMFEAVADAPDLLTGMETILQEHGEPGRDGVDAACVHGEFYGTVSSSSVVVDDAGRIVYRHAPGKPDVTPRADLSALLVADPQPSGSG
jgi:uncharacterized protein with NRDE domain